MEDQLEKYGNNLKHGVQRSPATDSAIRLCLAGTSGGAAYFLSVKPSEKEVPSVSLVAIFRPRHHFNSANWVGGRVADRGALKGGERNGRTWSRPGNIGHLVLEEESPH